MNKSLYRAALASAAAAFVLGATQASAAAPVGSTTPATAHAAIVKPLTLTATANLDFGSIVVQDTGTASIDTSGNITCPSTLTCAATGSAAAYHVTGTNNQVVTVNKPAVTLTNTANPGTDLTLNLTGPATVTLPNSGTSGTDFQIGGSIVIPANVKDGDYTGNLAVTVNY